MKADQRHHEIKMMLEQLRDNGISIVDGGTTTCLTLNGTHRDFRSIQDVHAYLMGALDVSEVMLRHQRILDGLKKGETL